MPRGKGKKVEEAGVSEAHVDATVAKDQAYSQSNNNSRDISIRGLDILYKETVFHLPK
jgi:hypothetical protein